MCLHKKVVRSRGSRRVNGQMTVQVDPMHVHPDVNTGPSIYTCAECGAVVS